MKKIIILAAIFGAASVLCVRADSAADNWTNKCAKCHGDDGKGQTKMGQRLKVRDYTDATVQASFKDADAFNALKQGLKDADGKTQMRPFDTLSDSDLNALVAYVRALKK
jgi:mono/diheme cytochrome c family protein